MTSVSLPLAALWARPGFRAERPRILLYAWWAPTESDAELLMATDLPTAKDCANGRSDRRA